MQKKWEKISSAISYVFLFILLFSFGFCMVTGMYLKAFGNILWTPLYSGGVLLGSGLFGVLGTVGYGIFKKKKAPKWQGFLISRAKNERKISKLEKTWIGLSEKGRFGLCMLCMFIGWLPYFLAYYPGICAYDAVIQIGQVISGNYGEHHPLAHTLWIRFCLFLGQGIFGNANAGVAIYTLVQMFFLAAVLSYGIVVLRRVGVNSFWQVVFLLTSMFYPFNGYLAVSMTKDIIFGGFVVLMLLFLLQILLRKEEKSPSLWIGFLVSTIGMEVFRNNGKYAFLVLLVFVFVAFVFGKGTRKFYGKLMLIGVIAMVISEICLKLLSSSVGAVAGDKREMLSMPIQQLARCTIYHGGVGVLSEDDGTMPAEDLALISELFREEGYANYLPFISDPVKNFTVTSVVRYQPKRFLTVYMDLLRKYPGDFINAALAVDAGYLYPGDESHSYVYQKMYPGMEGKGYVQTQWWESAVEELHITKASLAPGIRELMEKWADGNDYLKMGIFKLIYVPGIWLWITLLFLWILWETKSYALCLPVMFEMGYFVTLLLGPVVQLRYIYPVMITMPFLIGIWIAAIQEENNMFCEENR